MSDDVASPCADRAGCSGPILESPSLFRTGDRDPAAPPAFEVKFLLTDELAREVEARLRDRLVLDPHADARLGGAYRTTSLYTDTSDFEVFRRIGEYATTKFRVRRYGSSESVYLERKDKKGDRVHKTRLPVRVNDLTTLGNGGQQVPPTGRWFHQETTDRRLLPVCRIAYDRIAYVGSVEGGAVRVTFDRNVRGELVKTWDLQPISFDGDLLPGRVICEFKYRTAMPPLLKEVMVALGLHPTPCSKYRHFIASTGLAPAGATSANGTAHDE